MLTAKFSLADTSRIIIGVGPGATQDDLARLVSESISKKTNTTYIVDNRPGASGAIALEAVANSSGDGKTLTLVNNGTFNILPYLNPSVNYKPESFTPVTILGVNRLVLYVSNKLPVNNFEELVTYLKNNPGSWASPGVGTNPHLLGELIKSHYNLNMTHVLYKGMAQATIDVSENRVTMMFDLYNERLAGLISAGKLKPIIVTDINKHEKLPSVDTTKNHPWLTTHGWWAVVVPSSTPEPVVRNLRGIFNEIEKDPAFRVRLENLGFDKKNIEDAVLQKYIDSERVRWINVLKQSGIK